MMTYPCDSVYAFFCEQEQLHGLWEENNRMRRKLSALEQEKDRLQHVTNLDEMLYMQVWFTPCFMIIFWMQK